MELLGGRSVAAFLREHWHAQALLVTAAMPRFEGPVTRERLFALAGRDDVDSRIVQRARGRYALYEGPFSRAR
ncbi:MAG TPA: cupin domain-containing protein, partial [Casimicrobiaceae bacterium]|nr:cupin domain-containing protein [Casimicrobiaceae bacterium]